MKIRIISGSYGADNGRLGVRVIDRGQTCEVDEAEAKRLVALGVAVIETETPASQQAAPIPPAESNGEGNDTPEAGKPTEAQEKGESVGPYDNMKAQALRNLMKERGLPCKVGVKNADMIAALEAYDREHAAPEPEADAAALDEDPADVPDEDEIEDGELPPDLSVEAPSV